jgi:DNA/RNA endonuclease G (NUC1)
MVKPSGIDQKDRKFYIDETYYSKTQAFSKMHYDKGHMAPIQDFAGATSLLQSLNSFANCAPQNEYLNRGSWKNLESYCRGLLRNDKCDTLEIISGPVFYSGTPMGRDSPNLFLNSQVVMMENGLVVPTSYYKIVKANVGEK